MARSQVTDVKTDIRRTRTGCLTCRQRRVRCGEERPVCKNCSRKSRDCQWAKDGDKFRHHLPGQTVVRGDRHTALNSGGPVFSRHSYQLSSSPEDSFSNQQLPTPSVSIPFSDTPEQQSIDSQFGTPSSRPSYRNRHDSMQSMDSMNSLSADDLSCWRSEILLKWTLRLRFG